MPKADGARLEERGVEDTRGQIAAQGIGVAAILIRENELGIAFKR